MKGFSKWSNEEVKKLFEFMEKIKEKNKSLLEGFRAYAKKSKESLTV